MKKLKHKKALKAARRIKEYCGSIGFGCKGCVFDRATGCTLMNPEDDPETWELEGGKLKTK